MAMFAVVAGGSPSSDASCRVLDDVERHLNSASQGLKDGRWSKALAHIDVVAPIGKIKYRVEIDQDAGDKTVIREALKSAEAIWEAALNGQVDFVEDADSTGMVIRFQRTVQMNGREVGGHTKWTRAIYTSAEGESRGEVKANVWARTTAPVSGKPLTKAQLAHVVAHEIGHLVGLGDSPNRGDVMATLDLNAPASRLGAEELEAVRTMRERAFELRQESLKSALRELEGYNLPRASR